MNPEHEAPYGDIEVEMSDFDLTLPEYTEDALLNPQEPDSDRQAMYEIQRTSDWDFLRVFINACGTSEVPLQYKNWAGMGLISAALSNRVYYNRFSFKPLYPNLYIFLIGSSGIGKGTAIEPAVTLAKQIDSITQYHGKLTSPVLGDEMRRAQADGNSFLLSTPELASNIHGGEIARTFIHDATSMWEGHAPGYGESTRTHGRHRFEHTIYTWFAGSTQDWLIRTMTVEDLRGGFGARICPIVEKPNYAHRVYEPDREAFTILEGALVERLYAITRLAGPVILSNDARALDKEWYETRPAPIDSVEEAAWKRMPDMVIKLATILSVSDPHWRIKEEHTKKPTDAIIIKKRHIEEAQKAAQMLLNNAHHLAYWAALTVNNYAYKVIEDALKTKEGRDGMSFPSLLSCITRIGAKSKDFHAIMRTLYEERKIVVYNYRPTSGRNKKIAIWNSAATRERRRFMDESKRYTLLAGYEE